MSYPASLDSFSSKTAHVDLVKAVDWNAITAAITAIETELGIVVRGSSTDLVTRLSKALSGAGLLQFTAATTLTIATGSVTATQNYHRLDTEAAAASDDLDTITAGSEAQVLILRTVSGARNVVIKHGTGNINCAGGIDITLDNAYDLAFLVYDASLTKWLAFKGPTGVFGDTANHAAFSNTGVLTLSGTARIIKEVKVPVAIVTSGASAPTAANRAVGASGGILMPVLQFSKTTQNDIHFEIHPNYDMDYTVAAHFHLMWQPGASWTTGNYMWKLEYLIKNEGTGVINTGTPTTISADVTPTDAVTMLETHFTADITLALDEIMLCHLYRDVANDNGDDVGSVRWVELNYTSNKLGE